MEPIVKFWMVYRTGDNSPTYRHYTKEGAQQEAVRLAEKCPGELFVVLAAVGACKSEITPVQQVKVRRPTRDEVLDLEIPF